MKIIIATPLYPPEIGGPATFAKLFEAGLTERKVSFVTIPFSVVRSKPSIVRHVAYFWRVFRATRKGDVVLALDPVSVGLPALVAARLSRAQFFVRIGGDWAWEQGMQRFGVVAMLDNFLAEYGTMPRTFPVMLRLMVWVERYVARSAHKVLVQSSYFAGVIEWWGVEQSRVSIVPNAVEIENMPSQEEVRQRLGWKPEDKIILSAGRLVPWKGFASVIDAAKLTRQSVQLVVVGDGPEMGQLKDRALRAEENSTLKVHFVGSVRRQELMQMMHAADVFVLNTGYEGFSHQILEAMSVGSAIVTTDIPGNRDLVEHEKNALLASYDNVEVLAAQINRLLSDEVLASRLREAAKQKAALFTPERTIDGTLAALGIATENSLKVLMISGDPNVLKEGTEAHTRFLLQKNMVERLEVVLVARGQFGEAYRKLKSLRRQKFDVVTSQDPFWRGLIAWHVARRHKACLHIQVHTDLDAQSFIKHVLGQIVLRHADGVRVVSEKLKQQVEEKGIKASVSVLPIFVDLSRFRNIERISYEGKNILWIGRFEEEKDPAAAIEIFKTVQKEIPDAKLIMLGKGSLEASLKEQVKELPIQFPGWVHPVEHLATADIVISTSKHESWGASIVEALAAGVPVVAPDVGIAREAGAIVVPREKLADAVIDVLKSGQRGELKLHLPNAAEWAAEWYADIEKCCH